MTEFAEREARHIERTARRIVDEARRASGVHAGVAHEIALLLETLARARALHYAQLDALLRDECMVDSFLLRLERLHPWEAPGEFAVRARLLALNAERRALAVAWEEQRAHAYRELLALVEKYRLLDPDDTD
jgi:hypothetical protein